MIDAFLFLQRSDIAHFARVAQDFAGVPQIFIDPGLMDAALAHGLDGARFSYRPLAVGRHLQARIASEALTRAAAIDQRLTEERLRLLGDGPLQGWDQGPLRLFFIRLLTAKYLGELCERSFPEASIGLFRPTRPQQFYFDSCLVTDLFAGSSTRWQIVGHYDSTANWVDDSTATCFDFAAIRARVAAGAADAVTHIPTCYSHLAHFAAEIARAFPSNIDLPSPFWDIPVRRDRALVVPTGAVPRQFVDDASVVYRERARRVLEDELGPLLPDRAALAAQVDLMAGRCFVQALDYQGLLRALAGARPHFVVTDHDTGSNGPLFSVAARLGSLVTVLPHSSYPTGAIPHSLGVTVIERDGFATPTRSVWGEKVATRGVRLGAPAARVERTRLRTVCLLLNTMFSQGLSHVDFVGMAAFHRALVPLCKRFGASVLVRLKPNACSVELAAGALGVGSDDLLTVLQAPMHELAALSDLCITYGEPTTAGIDFLAAGSLLIHVGEQLWPSDYTTSPAFIGDGTVPSFVGADALPEIEGLLADETLFKHRAASQSERFAHRLGASDGRIFHAT